ncbi:MAG: hypothetical protein R3B96_22730 [Pirellulaceae bacterium]
MKAVEEYRCESEQSLRSVDFAQWRSWISAGTSKHRRLVRRPVGHDQLRGHTQAASWVAFLDDTMFVSAGDDGGLIAWDVDPAWRLERTLGSIDDPTSWPIALPRWILIPRVGGSWWAEGVPSRTGELAVFDL